MSLLGALDIAALRSVAESTMPGTCVIWRRTIADNGTRITSGTTTAAGTVACRVVYFQQRQPEARPFAGRQEERQAVNVYVPAGTDVRQATDYLIYTEESRAGTFDVIGVHGPRAYEPSRRLICVERK